MVYFSDVHPQTAPEINDLWMFRMCVCVQESKKIGSSFRSFLIEIDYVQKGIWVILVTNSGTNSQTQKWNHQRPGLHMCTVFRLAH